MLLSNIYQSYLEYGYESIVNIKGRNAYEYFYLALLAFTEDDMLGKEES